MADDEGPYSSSPRNFYDNTSINNSQVVSRISSVNESKRMPSKYYSDIQMIGKHYLFWNKKGIRRHYTISNCMEPQVYAEYMRVMKEFLKGNTEI